VYGETTHFDNLVETAIDADHFNSLKILNIIKYISVMPTDLAFPVRVREAEKRGDHQKIPLKTMCYMLIFLMAHNLQIACEQVNCK
jgi:hypothetical protein